jgi:uncharacterized protein Yka (UPF0111/DUF47 family)
VTERKDIVEAYRQRVASAIETLNGWADRWELNGDAALEKAVQALDGAKRAERLGMTESVSKLNELAQRAEDLERTARHRRREHLERAAKLAQRATYTLRRLELSEAIERGDAEPEALKAIEALEREIDAMGELNLLNP